MELLSSAMTTRFERWGVVLLYVLAVTGYPAISSIPLWLGLNSRVITVPFRAGVVIFSISFAIYMLRRRRLYLGRFWIPLLLFWCLYSLRLLVDTIYLPPPILALSSGEYWLDAIGICFLPMIPFFSLADDRTIATALRVLLWVTALSCICALMTAAVQLSGLIQGSVTSTRLSTETLNPISLGHLGVALMILAISYYLLLRPRTLGLRILLGGCLVLGLFTALAAASRGPLLVFILVLPILAWRAIQNGMRVQLAMFVLVLGTSVAIGASYVEDSLGFTVITRLSDALSGGDDNSGVERKQYMKDAFLEFVEHPLTGSSVDETNSHGYPHNVTLESFMATGVVGGTLFVVLLLTSAGAAVVLLRTRPLCMWVVLLYMQAAIGGQVSGSLYASDTLWAFMAAMISLAAGKPRQDQERVALERRSSAPIRG